MREKTDGNGGLEKVWRVLEPRSGLEASSLSVATLVGAGEGATILVEAS